MKLNSFSIIIPCYNCSKTIRLTLDSVFAQPYEFVEVICINDDSTDDTLQILQDYKDRITIVCNGYNKGQFYSRNRGIALSKNDFILFLDSDDLLSENIFIRLNSFIEMSYKEFDFACFGYVLASSQEKVMPSHSDVLHSLLTVRNYPCVVWNKIYRTQFLKSLVLEFCDSYCNFAEDLYFNIFLCNRAKKNYFIDETFYIYNDSLGISTSISKRSYQELEKMYFSAIIAYKKICSDIREKKSTYNKYLSIFKSIFFKRIYNFIFSHTEYCDLKKINNLTKPKKDILLLILHKSIFFKQKIKYFMRKKI